MLESCGLSVDTAENGLLGVEASKTKNYDLIFMDCQMPIMDGFEATRHLRMAGVKTPVIAVSAEINPEIERRARSAGADGVASKPLEAEALRQLAFKWVGLNSQAGAA